VDELKRLPGMSFSCLYAGQTTSQQCSGKSGGALNALLGALCLSSNSCCTQTIAMFSRQSHVELSQPNSGVVSQTICYYK
jgi:hypothetical protein